MYKGWWIGLEGEPRFSSFHDKLPLNPGYMATCGEIIDRNRGRGDNDIADMDDDEGGS